MVLPEFPLNVGEFLEVLRGWDRPGGPSLRGCAGFLFWASALEEPGRDPPLPLLGIVSPRSAPAGCRFKPFFAEATFAAVTIAYLSSVSQTPRNFFTTE